MGEFANFFRLQEMAARRSFTRTMGKYEPEDIEKPVATLTAWRAELKNPAGQLYPEEVRRRRNDAANEKLKRNIEKRGLSHYPVVGAGQEMKKGVLTVNKENSFIIQPIGTMSNDEFMQHVRELLWNPTEEEGRGPFPHTQWGASIKLPGRKQSFLSYHPGDVPTGPESYTEKDDIGARAEPRRGQERYYTQMKYGPRAEPAMMDPLDQPSDVGNPPPGKRGEGLPGQRFTIKDREVP